MISLKDIWRDFRQEHVAFQFICIYLFVEYCRPQMAYPVIDIIPWGKVLLFLPIFLCFTDNVSKIPPVSVLFTMLVFTFCVVLSMAFAFSTTQAFNEWVSYFNWLFVVLIITSLVRTRSRIFLFLVVYFLCNLKMAQHGFRTWAFRGFSFEDWGVTGSPGWFQNSGEFSLEMVVFLPLVISYIVTFRLNWSPWVRKFFYIVVIFVIGSIIGSSNRGGVVGLFVVGIWYFSLSRHRIRAILVLIVAAGLISYMMPTEFKARFETAGEDPTSLARLTYWKCGMDAIQNNYFTGVGFRNWTIWAAANHPELIGLTSGGGTKTVQVIHNTFMEAATELGLLGLGAYFIILLQIFFLNRQSRKMARLLEDRFLEATAVGLNGSLLGYMVPSYFMSVLYYPYIWILLALTVCVSSVCQQETNEKSAQQNKYY